VRFSFLLKKRIQKIRPYESIPCRPGWNKIPEIRQEKETGATSGNGHPAGQAARRRPRFFLFFFFRRGRCILFRGISWVGRCSSQNPQPVLAVRESNCPVRWRESRINPAFAWTAPTGHASARFFRSTLRGNRHRALDDRECLRVESFQQSRHERVPFAGPPSVRAAASQPA